MDIKQFLTWLLNSGGSTIVVSWILDQIPSFNALTANAKLYIFYGASVLVSVLAYLGLTYLPASVIAAAQSYFFILYGLFVTIILGKGYHALNRLTTKKSVQAQLPSDYEKG
jgi:hypothetical protein